MISKIVPHIFAGRRAYFLPNSWLCEAFVAALVALGTAWASLSVFVGTKLSGPDPLPAYSEFFAYSWIYGIRWGAGEEVFQPHSQLIYPIFAIINSALGMSHGTPEQIISGWSTIQIVWPAFLVAVSVAIVLLSANWQRPLPDVPMSTIILLATLTVMRPALFSTAYHTLSLPLAMLGLLLWKHHTNVNAPSSRFHFVALGFYTAACALGKPTFLAMGVPFFAMELARLTASPSARRFANLALAATIAISTYALAIIAFYHRGFEGLRDHLLWSRTYMESQFHWYDAAKGATPLHWYFNYVIGEMGYIPTTLLFVGIAAASFCRERTIILAGTILGQLAALFCLYSRPQLFGQQEFIATIAMIAVGSSRIMLYSNLNNKVPWLADRQSFKYATAFVAIGLCIPHSRQVIANRDYVASIAAIDAVVRPIILHGSPDSQTVAVTAYPTIFTGTIDAWCRGGSNLFNSIRSDFIDALFGNVVCADRSQSPNRDYSSYTRAVFIRKPSDRTDNSHLAKGFPDIFNRATNCNDVASLADKSIIVQCNLQALGLRQK